MYAGNFNENGIDSDNTISFKVSNYDEDNVIIEYIIFKM